MTQQVTRERATSLVAGGLLVVVVAVAVFAREPESLRAYWWVLLAFCLAIAVGEQMRVPLPARMSTAPLASAAALAMAMTTPHVNLDGAEAPADAFGSYGAGECVIIAATGMLIGILLQRHRLDEDLEPVGLDLLLRLFSVAVAALALRTLHAPGGRTLAELMPEWTGWQRALVLVAVAVAVTVMETPLRAVRRVTEDHSRWTTAIQDEFRTALGLGTAISFTGAVMAMSIPRIGMIALPLTMIPLGLTQFALRRQAATRQTYRQSVGALSRMPEAVGFIPAGHAARVAALSIGVGRELGMPERDIQQLEYAALLHDIGQVMLRNPIPEGATVQAATADQQRIADDGAEIVRGSDVMGGVAAILEKQAVPYHRVVERTEHLPLASRIIKVTNAFSDFSRTGPAAAAGSGAAALERLYLGLGYEYDPEVVDALDRVLTREQSRSEDPVGNGSHGSSRVARSAWSWLPPKIADVVRHGVGESPSGSGTGRR